MKVFVSAVTKGLGSYRQAVADYLWTRDIEPVEQKKFGIRSQQLQHLLKDLIRGCDAVICLIGPYFGYAPTDNPSRSYTQYEYFIASELQKEIFLFFASRDCRLDPLQGDQSSESDEQRRYQQDFHRWIETHDKRIRYTFGGVDELLRKTADAVCDVRGGGSEGGRPGLRLAIENSYPTPLVEIYDRLNGNSQQLYERSEDLLRFAGLLAYHDAVCAGGAASISVGEIVKPALCDDSVGRQRPWANLLDASCRSITTGTKARLVPELCDWNTRYHTVLENVLSCCGEFLRLQFQDRRLESQKQSLSRALTALFEGLGFLSNYLLVDVAPDPPAAGGLRCEVFRGMHPRVVEISGSGPAGLYLLDLTLRTAHSLSPVLFAESRVESRGVYGWSVLNQHAEENHLLVTPFGGFSPPEIQLSLRLRDGRLMIEPGRESDPAIECPACWLATGATPLMPDCACGDAKPPSSLNLEDDAWQALELLAFPERDPRRFLGGRFLVLPPVLHSGKHSDIIPAVNQESDDSESDSAAERFVVHQLRDERLKEADVREWFASRAERWQAIEHPCVLRVESGSDAGIEARHPFVAVRQVQGRDLESLLQDGYHLGSQQIIQIVRFATEVCQQAHALGLRLLTLPPRHFLLDESGGVWLTGFETAIPASAVPEKPHGWLSHHVRKFSRDGGLVAPEAEHQRRPLEPSVDVFAIGMLLARLRGNAGQQMDWLPIDRWSDPWECIQFHCLATQPAMRFRSPEHLMAFLDQLPRSQDDVNSRLLPPAAGNAIPLQYAHHLVTNQEYAAFCADRERPLPWHLRDLDRDDGMHRRRLAGPWLPVVFVDLEEARAYCDWLSTRFRRRVRLPLEQEWQSAAGEGRYPWGDAPPDPTRANYDRHYRGPTVVGAFVQGRERAGCADLAGNVWEWCNDRVYEGTPRRVLKGGAYDFAADTLCNRSRWLVLVRHRSAHVGFRFVVEG